MSINIFLSLHFSSYSDYRNHKPSEATINFAYPSNEDALWHIEEWCLELDSEVLTRPRWEEALGGPGKRPEETLLDQGRILTDGSFYMEYETLDLDVLASLLTDDLAAEVRAEVAANGY